MSPTATRRAASVRYAYGDSRFYRRPSSPEPFRDRVDLTDGDPLETGDLVCANAEIFDGFAKVIRNG